MEGVHSIDRYVSYANFIELMMLIADQTRLNYVTWKETRKKNRKDSVIQNALAKFS